VGTQIAYRLLRDHVPPLKEDREGTPDIEEAARLIETGILVREVTKAVPLSL
jgi:histidine ammonia-lyase